MTHLVLASASPRRRELLGQLNISFYIHACDIDETRAGGEHAEAYVCRMAREKARAAYQKLDGGLKATDQSGAPMTFSMADEVCILGADTTVVVGDQVLAKPQDIAEAREMLRLLSDRDHTVLSAVTMKSSNAEKTIVNGTQVCFKAINDDEIEAYCQTGEPYDKAGGYGIQGLAAVFIRQIHGSYSGVMGLPLFETGELLSEFGLSVLR